jgi:chromosome condensin MukBEF ATPase and DNA-binding subunit MukB
MHSFLTLVTFFWLLAGQFVYAAVLPDNSGAYLASRQVTASPALVANVSAAIARWLDDIEAVNNFVDTAINSQSLAAVSGQASAALVAAQNEGASLAILQADVPLGPAGQAAALALPGQFAIIGPAIQDVITNPQNLQQDLNLINGARCPPPRGKDAIAQESAVQQGAAMAVGLTVSPPPLPAACRVF